IITALADLINIFTLTSYASNFFDTYGAIYLSRSATPHMCQFFKTVGCARCLSVSYVSIYSSGNSRGGYATHMCQIFYSQ
ncbi:MAG TPA: hypothetical protein PLI57_04340, partial [Spirochaetota bacterium]|nr:hypothetical protein [Spirochaetota bacterium]